MTTHIVIGLFKGNRVMAHKKIRIKQLKKKNVLSCIKLYMLFHLVRVAYKSGYIRTKRVYMYAHTFTRGKASMGWKIKVKEYQGSIPWY